MSYLEINFWFLLAVAIYAIRMRKWLRLKPIVWLLISMLAMTAVFDNLIIGTGIVAYDESKILGLKIFLAPIEDFAYTLAAAILVPSIWNALRVRM